MVQVVVTVEAEVAEDMGVVNHNPMAEEVVVNLTAEEVEVTSFYKFFIISTDLCFMTKQEDMEVAKRRRCLMEEVKEEVVMEVVKCPRHMHRLP